MVWVREENASNMPLIAEKKSEISVSAEIPVASSSRRNRKPTVRFIAFAAAHPCDRYGNTSQRTMRRSRKSRMRSGASKKSSACLVGGVSSTIRS